MKKKSEAAEEYLVHVIWEGRTILESRVTAGNPISALIAASEGCDGGESQKQRDRQFAYDPAKVSPTQHMIDSIRKPSQKRGREEKSVAYWKNLAESLLAMQYEDGLPSMIWVDEKRLRNYVEVGELMAENVGYNRRTVDGGLGWFQRKEEE